MILKGKYMTEKKKKIRTILEAMPIETTILTEKKMIEKMKLSKEEMEFAREVCKYLSRR